MTFLGWLGSICLGLCGVPQAVKAWKEGNSSGISPLFIWLWFTGEVSFLVYVPYEVGWDWPLIVNLATNTAVCVVILKFLYFPRAAA